MRIKHEVEVTDATTLTGVKMRANGVMTLEVGMCNIFLTTASQWVACNRGLLVSLMDVLHNLADLELLCRSNVFLGQMQL